LERDYTKTLNNRYLMVYHGPIKQPRSGAKGRVAIILSREFDEVWRRTGNTLQLGGMSAVNITRLMELNIDLKVEEISKKKSTSLRLSLMSCYHPTRTYTDEHVTDFCDNIAQMIKKIPKSYLIIIGTDINAAIGTPQPQINNNIL